MNCPQGKDGKLSPPTALNSASLHIPPGVFRLEPCSVRSASESRLPLVSPNRTTLITPSESVSMKLAEPGMSFPRSGKWR